MLHFRETDTMYFKYRSLQAFEYFVDILLYQRLYAAPYNELNDPMEGMFEYWGSYDIKQFLEAMKEEKERIRICSLSETENNALMWAYYADGHRGVVIGVDVAKEGIDRVEYVESLDFDPYPSSTVEGVAREILLKKLHAWAHEKEVRVQARHPFIPVTVKRIHLGLRLSQEREALIRRLVDGLCPDVQVTRISERDLDIRP